MAATGQVKKGMLVVVGGSQVVTFGFNPGTVTVKKTAKWKPTEAKINAQAPTVEFMGTQQRTVTMQVLFDGWAFPSPTVLDRVERLMSWTCPTPASITANQPQPPMLRLEWNGITGRQQYYLGDVTATYTMFDESGKPMRATADLTLLSTPTDLPAQNPTSGGEPGTRQVTPVGGDTLTSLAYAQYGDAGLWRALAETNGLDDPLRVRPGTTLLVPPDTTARRLSAKPGPGPHA